MKALSLFSGIGGFDLAMERAGIEVVGMCEIDKNAGTVLKEHFPNATLHTDVRNVGKEQYERGSIDVICGGFPCQDLSIAGKRAGLAGERSGLWFEFARIIDELEPRWVIIENVPGLLSSNKGADFAVILQWLAQRGYGVCWRVLDARYFGVPQRRRRVFIVGSFGTGSSAEVLFESESLSRDPAESRKKRQATSGTFTVRSGKDGGGKGYLGSDEQAMTLGGQPQWAYNISPFYSNSMLSDNPLSGIQLIDSTRTLDNNGGNPACNQGGTMVVALAENTIGRKPENGGNGDGFTENGPMYTLNATGVHGVAHTLRANAKQSLMSGDGVINETLVYAPKSANTLAGGSAKAHSDMTSGQQDGNVIAFIKQRIDEYKEATVDATVASRDYKSATDIIAWNGAQITSPQNKGGVFQNVTPTLNSLPTAMVGVRRLTPTECERLQGFPDVEKSVIINICLDHQKTYANVESQNPKLPKRAGTVEKKDLLETAKSAENSLSTNNQQTSEPVDVHVHINLERQVLQIHSHGKLLLSVNIAERKNSSPLRMPIEDFVHLVVLTLTMWGKTTRNGEVVSHQNTMPSTIQLNGSNVAALFGEEIDALAAGAEEFIKMVSLCLTYTTLEVAQSSPSLEQISTISSYCVLTAIISSIPGLTNPTSSYNLKLSISEGWTSGQADTQRYKQLGNAVAVPVVQWIINRIVTITK